MRIRFYATALDRRCTCGIRPSLIAPPAPRSSPCSIASNLRPEPAQQAARALQQINNQIQSLQNEAVDAAEHGAQPDQPRTSSQLSAIAADLQEIDQPDEPGAGHQLRCPSGRDTLPAALSAAIQLGHDVPRTRQRCADALADHARCAFSRP